MCETREYQRIIDGLNGSSEGLHMYLANVGREELADNTEFLRILDEQIFSCPGCGWWCGQDEARESGLGEDVCRDCGNTDDDF